MNPLIFFDSVRWEKSIDLFCINNGKIMLVVAPNSLYRSGIMRKTHSVINCKQSIVSGFVEYEE